MHTIFPQEEESLDSKGNASLAYLSALDLQSGSIRWPFIQTLRNTKYYVVIWNFISFNAFPWGCVLVQAHSSESWKKCYMVCHGKLLGIHKCHFKFCLRTLTVILNILNRFFESLIKAGVHPRVTVPNPYTDKVTDLQHSVGELFSNGDIKGLQHDDPYCNMLI